MATSYSVNVDQTVRDVSARCHIIHSHCLDLWQLPAVLTDTDYEFGKYFATFILYTCVSHVYLRVHCNSPIVLIYIKLNIL